MNGKIILMLFILFYHKEQVKAKKLTSTKPDYWPKALDQTSQSFTSPSAASFDKVSIVDIEKFKPSGNLFNKLFLIT
jgi:hypothetical protein